jgi:hypothetical protein
MTLPLVLAIGLWVLCLVVGFACGFWTRSRPVVLAPVEAVAPDQDSPLLARARVLTADMDATCAAGTSGEFKRHGVYARLLKEFPGERKRACAMAIEQALQ